MEDDRRSEPDTRSGREFESGGTSPPIIGDFVLGEVLGTGGMGTVYGAIQKSLGREVALKSIHRSHLYFPGARESFAREIRAVARLHHPGIVPIYTYGEEEGRPYFTMERIHGLSLEQLLALAEPVGIGELDGAKAWRFLPREVDLGMPAMFAGTWNEFCIRVALQMAEAIAHAHAEGVHHLDLKPSNVMLTADGQVHLLDFGLASIEGMQEASDGGPLPGTLPYMAPEQIRGQVGSVDARTDIHGIGVVLYEMLTLRRPYEGRPMGQLRSKIVEGRARPIRSVNATIATDAVTITLTCMHPDREERYASAEDLVADLSRFLTCRPILARQASVVHRIHRWAQRRRSIVIGVAISILVLLALSLAWHFYQQDSRQSVEEARKDIRQQRKLAEELGGELGSGHPAGAGSADPEKGRQDRLEAEGKAAELLRALEAAAAEKSKQAERSKEDG